MFFECEFPRSISFKSMGGPTASTWVVASEGGDEQRNRNWAGFRRKYTASLITPASRDADRLVFAQQLEQFFMLVGGKADAFRFFWALDCVAVRQPLLSLGGNNYQLQKQYSLAGRTYTRSITKPIMSTIVDFQGNPLTDTLFLYNSGGALVAGTIDPTTGIVTSANSPVTASFQHHIPVRFDTDGCDMQIEDSDVPDGRPIVSWNSLALLEVKPPNY